MDSARPTVLVVDDDPAILRSLVRVLRDRHEVTTAQSVGDAMQYLLGGRRFDAILSDVYMPGSDGMDLYEEVRAVAPWQAERIIYVTGGGLPDRLESFLAARLVVHKPFELQELVRAIRRVSERPVPTPNRR